MFKNFNETKQSSSRQSLSQSLQLAVPAIKIRNIDAFIEEISCEVISDKVIIQGSIHKQLYFVGEDNMVHHQQESMPFSTFIEVPGAEPGMEAQVDGVIEHIKATLSADGTEVFQKAIVELFVKVLEEQQLFLACDPQGPLLKVDQVIGEGAVQTLIEGEVTLPLPAIKVSDIDVTIRDISAHVIADKVIIQGIIHKQIYYIGEDDLGHHLAEDVPFSTFVDIPGAQPGMEAQLYPRLEFVDADLAFDGVTLLQKVVLEIFVKVTEELQMNLALGDGPLLKLPRVIGENVVQHMLTNDFTLPQAALKIVEVDAHFQCIETRVITDKVIVQGVLEKQIFFIGLDDVEYHQAELVPFSTFIDLPGAEPGMDVQITGLVEHVKFELLGANILHQKVILQFFVKIVEYLQINVALAESGPLFKAPAVIGEGVKQVLVEVVEPPIIPPIPPVVIAEGILIQEVRGGESTEQILVESIVNLPVCALRIKEVEPSIRNVVTEIVDGQILVEGEIVKLVRYVDNTNRVRQMEEIVPFAATMNVPSLAEGMDVIPLVEIEDLSFTLIDQGMRLAQTIILRITINAEESRQVQVFTDIEGPEIVMETTLIRAPQVIGEDLSELEIIENIALAEVAAFPLSVEAFLTDVTGTISPDLVSVSGTVIKDLTLVRPDETEFTIHEEIPFTMSVVITDALPTDNLQINPSILDIFVDIVEGGLVARETVVLEIFVKVTRLETFPVVVDVLGPVEVTKDIVYVDVVDDGIPGPVPLEVVVDVGPIE